MSCLCLDPQAFKSHYSTISHWGGEWASSWVGVWQLAKDSSLQRHIYVCLSHMKIHQTP